MNRIATLVKRCTRMRQAGLTSYLIIFLLWAGAAISPHGAVAASEGTKKISLHRGSTQLAVFNVEIASEDKKRQKGLSHRPPIPDDSGMLFILDSGREEYFWMKGMEFPIDMLFFDREKKLLEILPDLSPCEQCAKYLVPAQTVYVLEINAGLSGVLGIRRGDGFVFTDN